MEKTLKVPEMKILSEDHYLYSIVEADGKVYQREYYSKTGEILWKDNIPGLRLSVHDHKLVKVLEAAYRKANAKMLVDDVTTVSPGRQRNLIDSTLLNSDKSEDKVKSLVHVD